MKRTGRPGLHRALFPLVAALVLTACGNVSAGETLGSKPGDDALPGLDADALQASLPAEDAEAFAGYLPVLRGETPFHWVAGPYRGYPDNDWETRDVTLADFHDALWEDREDKTAQLDLDSFAVQDLDGDGVSELILFVRDMDYNYLILHQSGADFYGTDFPVRWLEGLQKNGVYYGSGGAGNGEYHQIAFEDGRFTEQTLGRQDSHEGSHGEIVMDLEIGGEAVTEETFRAWETEIQVGDVTWYLPED